MEPAIALSNAPEQCVTFFWPEMPDYYLGYRFVEGQPAVSDRPFIGYEKQAVAQGFALPDLTAPAASQPAGPGWQEEWRLAYTEPDPQAPVQLSFQVMENGVAHIVCVENDGQQQQEFIFQPFSHGVRMWATLTTQTAITGAYCRQHCLRFTGLFNSQWRRVVAHMPFLSELDMQAMGNANGTLTYARRANQWCQFPVQHTIYPTHPVRANDTAARGEAQGDPVDLGLIVRETASRQLAPASYWQRVATGVTWEQISSGLYWERTAYISNRHPADCVHAWLDFGPLAAGQSRTLRGAVYFVEGPKDELLALWQRDFKDTSQKLRV
jgi:hypothetical protein